MHHNSAVQNAVIRAQQGEQVFRFDTFGDEVFWGDTLKRHQAIEGAGLGGAGPEDGWPNRDLNLGAIVALAPDLTVVANLLSTDQATVRKVLNTWGPGEFDAELLLDGKAFNPQQVSDGVVKGTNVSGASLIPPAFRAG